MVHFFPPEGFLPTLRQDMILERERSQILLQSMQTLFKTLETELQETEVTKRSLSASSQIAKPSYSRTDYIPHFHYLGIFCNLFCELSTLKEGSGNSLMMK